MRPCSRHSAWLAAGSDILCVVAVIALATPRVAAAGDPQVVTCGQEFSGQGVLAGNCTGTVVIGKGTLDLAGFTITGAGLAAIDCDAACKVYGPGALVGGGSAYGILAGGRVSVQDVDITGHSTGGITTTGSVGAVSVRDSSITDNGTGISAVRVKLRASGVSDNVGSGVVSSERGVRVHSSTVTNNGKDGIAADVVSGNLKPNKVKIRDTLVMGNGEFGIIGRGIKYTASTVTGNGTDAECDDTIPCADLGSVTLPRFAKGSICLTSMMIPEEFIPPLPFGETWGVCLEDFQ